MVNISHLRRDHICFCASCKIKELIELVRSYVSNNPAKIFFVKKPLRARLVIRSMRSHCQSLGNPTNSTIPRRSLRLDRSAVFRPFGVQDRIDSAGLFRPPATFFKLCQAGTPPLISDILLPMLRQPDAYW